MTANRARVVCTAAHGPHRELLAVTRPALERYAARHDYEVVVVEHRLAASRPPSWDKIALLHDLADRHDVVCWIDADALVLERAPDITDATTRTRFLHMVEHRIDGSRVPNAGVMVMRGGPVTRRFLGKVWARHHLVHHHWWDNAAILDVLGYRLRPTVRPARPSAWRAGVGWLDTAWNSIPANASPNPNVVHFPGMPIEQRLHELKRYAAAPS